MKVTETATDNNIKMKVENNEKYLISFTNWGNDNKQKRGGQKEIRQCDAYAKC